MQGTQKTGAIGHELSVATCLASVLVGCIMRTSAIIIVLGQSHCPHRLAAAPEKRALQHLQPKQRQATSQHEGAGPVQGTGGRAQAWFVCVYDCALEKDDSEAGIEHI